MAEQSQPTAADRRTVLRTTALGVAAAGVGVTAAACSSGNSMAQGAGASTAQPAGGGTGNVATTSQVPVNGGYVNQSAAVVVTQPSAGQYKAFSAVCTHAGCTVATVSNNVILCPCHGSQFNASTGEVIQGPASQPLPAKSVKVQGNDIVLEG